MKHITSRKNDVVTRYRRLGADSLLRKSQGLYLCYGIKLLEEALRSGADIVSVLADHELSLPPLPQSAEVVTAPVDVVDSVAPGQNSQGVLFLIRMPKSLGFPPSKGRFFLLDRLQDPGNVGSILRTAEAFALSGVYLIDCCDPFSPKTARAGMGALFRVPVGFCRADDLAQLALPVYAANISPDSRPVGQIDFADCVVALGNEGSGLSSEILSLANAGLEIPMPGQAESLGVAAAAAVIGYHMRQEVM
ncbi:MAG: RNA methyltransferase [Oscillospiraceae bacterium]|nr:RNA methyltransferase [Oscillospiraceae bacterium]